MSDPKEYCVGWICALSTEYTAAKLCLDETHPAPEPLSRADANSYTVGKIGKHKVVIAVLPDGEYGISSAATVARDMLHSFPNITVGIMVGIGGGAPSSNHDIRLGDIVVSASRDGRSGVFQYDLGKAIQNQSFRPTGVLNQTPTSLRTALSDLRSHYEIEGHQLRAFIEGALEKKPRLQRKYRCPDPTSDKLYRSDVIHPPNNQASCAVVCGDTPSHFVLRDERRDDEDNPKIHYGLIASSNQLMKDALARDRLSAENNVLCFEMEAAGLMNHFPCLVIRGICDYADSHKNKEWQGYAAMTAAAYARDLLRLVTPGRVESEERISDMLSGIKDDLKSISNDVNVISSQQQSQQQSNENKQILDWLSKIDFGAQQRDYLKRRERGTGQWFLDSKNYQIWLHSEKQSLFCPGIPGAGKTILASIVVNDLFDKYHSDSTVGIAYVYCNFQLKSQQKTEELLSNLLKQLAQEQPSSMEILKDLHSRHKSRQTEPSLENVFEALQSVVDLFSRVFVIVDALDEISKVYRDNLLVKLFKLQKAGKMNILVTSRVIPDIVREFEDAGSSSLEISARGEDVKKFIEGHLNQLPAFVHREPALQDDIKTKISEAVDGMFLLAQIYLNSLNDKTTPREIQNALEKLQVHNQKLNQDERSELLFQAYGQAMERITGQLPGFANLAKRTLSWVTYARRPLTTLELQHALAVSDNYSDLDLTNITDVELMVSVCAGLITVNEESGVVRLVHFTTQEYFESTGETWFPDTHKSIATACVGYLSFDRFKSGFLLTDWEFQERLRANAFYEYASQNWGFHAREASEQPDDLILTFLECQSNVSSSSQAVIVPRGHARAYGSRSRPMTALHLTAYFGLKSLTCRLLELEHDGNARDRKGLTPVTYAAAEGHDELIKVFSKAASGVCMDPKHDNKQTPLSWAAMKGYEKVVQQLLDTGKVDPDCADKVGRTPLFFAVKERHESIARFLLTKTTNPDATYLDRGDRHNPMNNRSVLSFAAEAGMVSIVKLLLRTGMVNINSESHYKQTPLSYAAERGRDAVVEILLENGADLYLEGSTSYHDGKIPLSFAAENGHVNVVKLLLDRGVHPDSKARAIRSSGHTPLWRAVSKGHEAVVKLLIQRGADPESNHGGLLSLLGAAGRGHESVVLMLLKKYGVDLSLKDNWGRTLLSYAAEKWHTEVMQFIIHEGGMEMDVRDGQGRAPISYAAEAGQEEIVELLLKGVEGDVDFKDRTGRTPLSYASGAGNEATVELLLKSIEGDVDLKDTGGRTPLSYAAEAGRDAVVRRLLRMEGLNINSKDIGGHTPLSYAAKKGGEAAVYVLLGMEGVDVNSKDAHGRTPISHAAESSGAVTMQQLLNIDGVDVDCKDDDGRTPLSYAAQREEESIVQLILEKGGIDINSTDNGGRTPLSYAAKKGREAAVHMLLGMEGVDVNSKDTDGKTPLSHAAEWGSAATMQQLLNVDGVDVNTKDGIGRTPLSYAVLEVWGTRSQVLLNRKDVNVNIQDNEGRTPLSHAAELGRGDVVYQLLKRPEIDINSSDNNGRTPLSYSAACKFHGGGDEVVQLLLDRVEIEFEGKDHTGRTPLSHAAGNGETEVVQLLLNRGRVDVNSEDNNGRTPLSHAVANWSGQEVVKLLLSRHDIDVERRDRNGRTPFSYTAGRGDEAMVQLLLNTEKVNINSKDNNGQTPLSNVLAGWSSDAVAVAEILLARDDIEADAKDENGRTPLSYAAEKGRETVVKLLLGREVDAEIKDNHGRTPLSYAAERNFNNEVVRLLLDRDEVDLQTEDDNGCTPLSYALAREYQGHHGIAKLIQSRTGQYVKEQSVQCLERGSLESESETS